MVAAVLWTGHESESWQNGAGAIGVSTNTGTFDTNFSRCSAVLGLTPVKWGLKTYGGRTELWFRLRPAAQFGVNVNTNNSLVEFRNAANQGILRLFCNGNPSTLTLQYWSGSVWVSIGSSVATTLAMDSFVDIVCKIHGTTGWFGWWINGTKEYELTGNTNFFASSIDSTWIAGVNNANGSNFSEIIAADGETLGMRCATLAVTGAGAVNTFTSGTFADVDETTVNDADMIVSNTAAQEAVFALSDLSAAAQLLLPVAVQVNMRLRNGVSPPQNVQSAVRVGSTNYFSPNLSLPTTSFQNGYGYVWNQSPATAAPWTISEINAAQAGPKSIT